MNIVDTLLSQYANSPIIIRLLEGLEECLNPATTIEDFYNDIFNVSTAKGYGLDVWGRIVGISRNVPRSVGKDRNFGFNKGSGFSPFNDAPFSGSGSGFTSYALPDSLYRQLIIIKAYANIIYATAPNINAFLFYIFQKRCYYRVTGDMQAEYVFEFTPTAFERLIIFSLNILPIPCGISVEYTIQSVSGTLGFNGSNLQTFNNGTFRQ